MKADKTEERNTTEGKAHFSRWDIGLKEQRLKKVSRLIMQQKPGRLLDVGCSSGSFSSRFLKSGFDVFGIDYAENHIKEANKRGIKAVAGDITKRFPFKDAFFDIILAGEVIEHVVDTDHILAEFNRLLKPGGALIITTPNLASFENRVRLLLGFYPAWINYNISPPNHIRSYTPCVLKKQLKSHGFKVLRHTGNFVPFIPQHILTDVQFPLLGLTGDLLPGLSQDIIILATK